MKQRKTVRILPIGCTITSEIWGLVSLEDIRIAVSRHWYGYNGNGTPLTVEGWRIVSKHRGSDGFAFVVVTTAPRLETWAMLESELQYLVAPAVSRKSTKGR